MVGLRCTKTRVPGGARGVALKLKLPKRYACADRDGFAQAVQRRLSVRKA